MASLSASIIICIYAAVAAPTVAVAAAAATNETCPKGILYDITDSFDVEKANLSASFLNISSVRLMVCGAACLKNSQCMSAVFDKNTKLCSILNKKLSASKKVESPYTLINVKKDICDGRVFNRNTTYEDCQDAFEKYQTENGVYTIKPDNNTEPFWALCQFDSTGGWTVIQSRLDNSTDFFQNWTQYVKGFGSASREYWLGLENIHHLTNTNKKLSVYLEAHDGEVRTANYSSFTVHNSTTNYTLAISGYYGTAGESLYYHNGRQFTTFDADNDISPYENCAVARKGAWWYHSCTASNLNGLWYSGGNYTEARTGACWYSWKGTNYSYRTIYMRVGR